MPGRPRSFDRAGDVVVHSPGHVGELGVAGQLLGQRGAVRRRRAPSGPASAARHLERVLDERRVGPDGLLREAHGQVVAVAVEDRPAVGGEGDVLEALRRAEGGVLLAAERLHLHEAHDDGAERQHEHEEGGDQAQGRAARATEASRRRTRRSSVGGRGRAARRRPRARHRPAVARQGGCVAGRRARGGVREGPTGVMGWAPPAAASSIAQLRSGSAPTAGSAAGSSSSPVVGPTAEGSGRGGLEVHEVVGLTMPCACAAATTRSGDSSSATSLRSCW